MPPIKMYTTGYCPYCVRAKALLQSKGVLANEELRIDTDPAQREDIMRITGRRTVPQIFIAGEAVGGCDDLMALDRDGRLDTLLGL